ncbi:hypothetical protein AK812_SmicGene6101 [Symbiodinium microadriaticum]|uniref:C3H1-type domain-containing protein n=1 Tax=Symbiodinium microadriaticum TaxID=2951 RepID=A0A1Q9ERV4_SYMMI|nr:hypothetical protein AK812_SmicGene6101 [Symbiodinium microadriaticum]
MVPESSRTHVILGPEDTASGLLLEQAENGLALAPLAMLAGLLFLMPAVAAIRLGRVWHGVIFVITAMLSFIHEVCGGHAILPLTSRALLPLLMRAFVATVGVYRSMLSEMYWQASTAWQDCVESLGGAFWELRLGKADWPELHATYGRSVFGTQNHLQVFMCAPGIFQHDQWLPPVIACGQVENLIKEVLPLSLRLAYPDIFLHGDGRLQLPPPRGTGVVQGGEGLAGQALLWDLRARAVRSQAVPSSEGQGRLRAAVCIAGLARSLWMPEVHKSIAENVTRTLGARTQIFYVLDLQGRKLRDFSAAFRMVPPDQLAFYDERKGISGTWSKLARCHWTPGDNSHHVFAKFQTCLHMITEAEKAQGFRFHWVLRLRPDMAWMAPIGNLGNLDSNSVHILRKKTFPYPSDTADTFAIVPRKHLNSYFGTGCPNERDVRWAYHRRMCYGLSCNATGCSTISECALQIRLASRSVPVVAFPPLMQAVDCNVLPSSLAPVLATGPLHQWVRLLDYGSDETRLPEGAEVPRCILEQFPVTVRDRSLIQVPGPRLNRNICDRIIRSRNCDRLSNCPHIHPDFIAERWVVPDLLCHKWFQGTCGFGDRCWNQHGETFDKAVALAIQTQQGLRREMAPFLYDPGAAGGSIRQVDREEARRYIKATIMQFRMSTIRKWHFGTSWTTYYEYASFAPSDLARRVWEEAELHLDQQAIHYPAEDDFPSEYKVSDTTPETDHDISGKTFLRWAQHGDGVRRLFGSSFRCSRVLFPPRRCGGPRSSDTDDSTVDENNPEPAHTVNSQRVLDDDDLWNAAEDEVREVVNQDIPASARPASTPTNVVSVKVLNSPTIRSTLTPFGLFVDFPVYHNSERTLEERVLFLGVPNNFYDPQTTLIYSMVWHTITASLSELHHTSVEARFDRLRGWCLFSVDVHRVSVNYSYINWISTFMRLIGDAIIDCAWAMLPPNMRTYFAGHPDMAPYFTAELPNFVLRTFPALPQVHIIMAPRRASELKHDKIEQYPDTQPMEEDDPIEPTTAPSQSSDAVLPAARALAEMTRGVEPDSVEGRLMKQRCRLYDEQTAQVAVEVLAFRRAQEQMGLARLRTQFSNADSNQLFVVRSKLLYLSPEIEPGTPSLAGFKAERSLYQTKSSEWQVAQA